VTAKHGRKVHVAMLWVQTTFGVSHVFAKYVVTYMSPLAVAAIRVALATPLLLLLAWRVDRRLPEKRDLPALAGLGLLGVTANQLLFVYGLQHTKATNAAILQLTIPIFTVAIAAAARIERFDLRKGVGVGLSVLGALALLDPLRFAVGDGATLGNVLITLNCLCYSVYLVWQRPLLERLPPLTLVAWAFVFGGAATILAGARTALSVDAAAMPTMVWVGLAYAVLIQTAVNYAVNAWAMRRSTPSLISSYTTLQPVTAAAVAAAALGERVGWREGLGFALIVAGLALVSRAATAPRRAAPRTAPAVE
jgi:drug/metabolite transporter (DMT)-like permease